MDIVFGETRATLPPASRQRDPYGVQDSCFACVVLADEDGCLSKLRLKELDRAEVLYAKARDAHVRRLGSVWSATEIACLKLNLSGRTATGVWAYSKGVAIT